MPKDDAERARPPAHQARTKHPPTHPARAAQPHRHPERIKGPHEPPVTMGTDRKDRHESPARKPVRPKATPQPDDGAQQGHDLRLLMKRGLISEKALGRSLPGYQMGGRPIPGEPALVGEEAPPNASDLEAFGSGPLTAMEQIQALAERSGAKDLAAHDLAAKTGTPLLSRHFWHDMPRVMELGKQNDVERARGVPDTSMRPGKGSSIELEQILRSIPDDVLAAEQARRVAQARG